MWVHRVAFIHSSVRGHLGSFHFLSAVNNAAVNIYAQEFAFVFVQVHSVLDSRGTCGCGIAGSYGNYSYVYAFQESLSKGVPMQHSGLVGCGGDPR